MYLTPRPQKTSILEWLCRNQPEIESYLQGHTQLETAKLLGISTGQLSSVVTAWDSVPGFFPRYRGGQPVELWLEEVREAVEILRGIFKKNSALTAAYMHVPRGLLRKAVNRWDAIEEVEDIPEAVEVKLRNCLRCGKEFASTGNRMCGCAVKESDRYWEI
jgi:hypothetical protein